MPDVIDLVYDPAEELVAESTRVQEAVEASLFHEGGVVYPAGPDALEVGFLQKYGDLPGGGPLEQYLGEFMAERLLAFAKNVDGSHPCFANLAADKGECVRNFGPVLSQMLDAMEEAVGKDVVIGTLRKGFLQHKEFRGVRNLIASPPVRSLKTAEARDAARKKKTMKRCPMRPGGRHDEVRPGDCPSSFMPFVRGGQMRAAAEENCRIIADNFSSIGCVSIASRFVKRQRLISKMLEESYMGFIRTRMNLAGMVAAKFHGCTDIDGLGMLGWSPERFADNPPWLQPDVSYNVVLPGQKVARRQNIGSVPYAGMIPCEVRAYPLHQYPGEVSGHAAKVLEHLEAFPETGGRAAFDHFWALVPSIQTESLPFNYGGHYAICDKDDLVCYRRVEELHTALDAMLIRQGVVHSVLLGETDGKCYFVSIM